VNQDEPPNQENQEEPPNQEEEPKEVEMDGLDGDERSNAGQEFEESTDEEEEEKPNKFQFRLNGMELAENGQGQSGPSSGMTPFSLNLSKTGSRRESAKVLDSLRIQVDEENEMHFAPVPKEELQVSKEENSDEDADEPSDSEDKKPGVDLQIHGWNRVLTPAAAPRLSRVGSRTLSISGFPSVKTGSGLQPSPPDSLLQFPLGNSETGNPGLGSDGGAGIGTECEHENPRVMYLQQREQRGIYRHNKVHTLALRLLFRLIISPNDMSLHPLYCDRQPVSVATQSAAYQTACESFTWWCDSSNRDDNDLLRSPMAMQSLNIPFLLQKHLNEVLNNEVALEMYRQESTCGAASCARLMRLLCPLFFDASLYRIGHRLGRGRFGSVYECVHSLPQGANAAMAASASLASLASANLDNVMSGKSALQYMQASGIDTKQLAAKASDVPKGIDDYSTVFDVFQEVSVLETMTNNQRVLQIFDYGQSNGCYWLILKYYPTDLRGWRLKQTSPWAQVSESDGRLIFTDQLRLYFDIYHEILLAAWSLRSRSILHLDLKCDNVLLNSDLLCCPLSNIQNLPHSTASSPLVSREAWSDADLYASSMHTQHMMSPYMYPVCVADFGESAIVSDRETHCTRLSVSRGTENIQSPEMLLLSKKFKRDAAEFDRRRDSRIDHSSDVWSLGCLFFELITGCFLFEQEIHLPIFYAVTSSNQSILRDKQRDLIHNHPLLSEFIEFVLERDKSKRPQLEQVYLRFLALYHSLFSSSSVPASILAPTRSVSLLVTRPEIYLSSLSHSLACVDDCASFAWRIVIADWQSGNYAP